MKGPADSPRFKYDALPGRVVFAPGSARTELVGALDAIEARRPLAVFAEAECALAEKLLAPLGDRVVGIFNRVQPHVPLEVAEAARTVAADLGADSLLSIGGGSTTGTAKAVALETGFPIVAVPTTYAGSEMTPIWGMTAAERKTTGRDSRVLPKVVIYDPELTLSLPPAIACPSALNALAHCIETFYAPKTSPIPKLFAADGIEAIADSLAAVANRPEDLGVRGRILYGAYLSGSALAVAGSGLHHKICHVLGGKFDLPHAETHTVVLPQVLAFNEPAMGADAVRIRAALGGAAGESAAAAIFDLTAEVGAPTSLAAIGMPAEGIASVSEEVVAALPAGNPRPVGVADVESLLNVAYEGRRPAARLVEV